MSRRSRFPVAAYFIISCWLFVGGCERVDITKYDGDGRISVTSNNFLAYGYQIAFDTFSFLKPFSRQYKISNLPEIDKEVFFSISTTTEKGNLQDYLEGDLSLKLSVPNGQVLFDCSAPLKEWTFGESRKASNMIQYSIYFFHGSTVTMISPKLASELKELTLLVNYNPKSTNIDLVGIVKVEAGGFY